MPDFGLTWRPSLPNTRSGSGRYEIETSDISEAGLRRRITADDRSGIVRVLFVRVQFLLVFFILAIGLG